jgi:alpha-L-fucosidase 2
MSGLLHAKTTATLDFDAPAGTWLECLPLGNGTLGAMLDGGIPLTRIRLNDETAWSGSRSSELAHGAIGADDAARQLQKARDAVASGDPIAAASALTPLQVRYSQAFVPFATILLTRSADDGAYRRRLDLDTAVHEVRAGRLRERTFVSAVHGVLVHRIEGADDVPLEFETPLRVLGRRRAGAFDELLLRLPSDVAPGHEPDYPGAMWSDAPGSALEGALVVGRMRDGSGMLVVAATETTYARTGIAPARDAREASNRARERVRAALALGGDALLAAHLDDYAPRFARARVVLGAAPVGDSGEPLTTPERLARVDASPQGPLRADPALVALAFDFGRYLLLSSARPGSLPPTLQGIWNDELRPPWSSNYTLNINTQMNFWAAHTTSLDECAVPLWDFIAALADAGRETALRLYGAPGWVAHHNSDVWSLTHPVGAGHGDAKWTAWPLAGPWLVTHIGDAVAFGAIDDERLAALWPAVRGAAAFALDWIRRDADGAWVTSPATSPENAYLLADGTPAAIDTTTTMDLALLRAALTTSVVVAERLGIADPLVPRARERIAELPAEPAVGADGAIVEFAQERALEDEHHRHVSHLVGLYPGTHPWSAAARDAAAVSLSRRGDESSGWSLVWKSLLWARLGRGERAGDVMKLLFRPAESVNGQWAGGLYPNLFAAHPPFQIDANLGFPAVIAEMLVQSHDGIELLPALPADLESGSARGLIARPGVEVQLAWSAGVLVWARLTARAGIGPATVRIRYAHREIIRELPAEGSLELAHVDFAADARGAI